MSEQGEHEPEEGSGQQQQQQTPPGDGDQGGGGGGTAGGDGAAQAVAAERRARAAAERRAKDLQEQLDKAKASQMTEQERAVAEARAAGAAEASRAALQRLFGAEVRAAVAGKVVDPTLFAKPAVAMELLGFTELPLTDDGEVDSAAIQQAVETWVAERPFLAPQNGRGGTSHGSADQGARQQPRPKAVEDMSPAELKAFLRENDPQYERSQRWAQGKAS